MKTLRNIFEIQQSEKSINNFSMKLGLNEMINIKGGTDDGDDGDLWPPTTGTGTQG